MTPILITDANIFIDLIEIDALSYLFAAEWSIHTTDEVLRELFEEQRAALEVYARDERLTILAVDEDAVRTIKSRESRSLSDADCTVIALAQATKGSVLSGDRRVIKVCRKYQLEAHGILWCFDELIVAGIISKRQAYKLLTALMKINTWLPLEECEQRLQQWRQQV